MVIVLGLEINGLTVCRALGKVGIPLIGVAEKRDSIGSYSRYLGKVYCRNFTDQTLLNFLFSELPLKESERPLLFPTTDQLVEFVARNFGRLSERFTIGFRHAQTVASLLDKDNFRSLAERHGLRVAGGAVIEHGDPIQERVRALRFPVILKTCKKHYAEKEEDALPKAVIFKRCEDLVEATAHFVSKAGKVVVEEYVEGGDDDVYFVFVYCNRDGKAVQTFCGQKLKQWPVGTGGTASARPFQSPVLVEATVRFFQEVGFTGLGSMEYKLDRKTGLFFAIEPTVGRIDFQEGLAIGNGVNFPALLYGELFGKKYQESAAASPREWLCFDADYNASSQRAAFSLLDRVRYVLSNLSGRKIFSVFDLRDVVPFMMWAKKRFLDEH